MFCVGAWNESEMFKSKVQKLSEQASIILLSSA